MVDFNKLDFEPIARQVYDALLVYIPDVPIEGLFRSAHEFFIVCPSKDTSTHNGKSVSEWFNSSLKPLAMPIRLVASRPSETVELKSRSRMELSEDFGIVRTEDEAVRDLSVSLSSTFPLLRIEIIDRTLVLVVNRELSVNELHEARTLVDARGLPLPLEVRIELEQLPDVPQARTASDGNHTLDVLPVRRLPGGVPGTLRAALEEDETFWRDNYRTVLQGQMSPLDALKRKRYEPGEACLVCTTFPPENIRTYFSMFSNVVLAVPLADALTETINALGITRKSLMELISRGDVSFIAPQSPDRYDQQFLQEVLEANPLAITWSRRLAAASFLDQVERNPLFALPGTALDRRVALRALGRLEQSIGKAAPLVRSMRIGLSTAWPYYEHIVHVRGAMAGLSGPLSSVASALAKEMWGNDYTLELSAAALPIEWASTLGASFAPFQSEGYSETAHAEFLIALQSGVERNATPIARATEFSIASDLLVLDNDTNVIDLVHELQTGDLSRFRALVRDLGRPSRSLEEMDKIVTMWNSQVRAYERRADRLRSMSLVGFVLGGLAKTVGAPDLVSASTFVVSALPALLTLLNEEVIGERESAGALLDGINAKLANVHRDAVLLSRMKKRVAGMKDKRSPLNFRGRG